MKPLDFNEKKAFKRLESFDQDLALYQTDIPTFKQDTFWLQINKLIQQDKVYIQNNSLYLNYSNLNNPFG